MIPSQAQIPPSPPGPHVGRVLVRAVTQDEKRAEAIAAELVPAAKRNCFLSDNLCQEFGILCLISQYAG